jgi:translocation and assembly module TamA
MPRILFILLSLFSGLLYAASIEVRVELYGLTAIEEQWVSSKLSIKAAEKETKLTNERLRTLYQLGIEEITDILQALGYYHSTIKAQWISTATGVSALYNIKKGPVTYIREVKITLKGPGQSEKEIQSLLMRPPLQKGTPLKHDTYENFKHELLGKALQLGYLDAAYNANEIRVNLKQKIADIILELDTGPRYFFGEVLFNPNPYSVEYLKRYIPFKAGEPYTTEKLLLFQKSLTETDLFTKVRIDPQVGNTAENTLPEKLYSVPLKVRLTARPKNKYTASAGYGTDLGPRGMLGWERRIRHFPGHKINLNVQGSKRQNQANLLYTIPGLHPTTDRLVLNANIVEERFQKKYSLSRDLGINKTNRIGLWERMIGLNFLYAIDKPLPTHPKQRSHFLLPSIGVVRTKLKKSTYFVHGNRFSVTLRGAARSVLSSTNLVQLESRLKWIPLLNEKTRLITRLDLGATAVSKMEKVPLKLRFFTGGDQTVRGYGYQSLGPRERDTNGGLVNVGGRYLFVSSIEIERLLYNEFSIAVFADAGNAMNKIKTKLKSGAGIGFRYNTPLGPLRFDLAKPLLKGKHKPRIHLSFGMDL